MIIFDLDDTLIDTSGSITTFRLKQIIEKFIERGLINCYESSYKKILEISAQSVNTMAAVGQFLKNHGGSSDLLEEARKIYANPYLIEPLKTLPLANKILSQLRMKYLLAILTYGEEVLQRQKLKKAGIDTELFSKIIICPKRDKKEYYKQILEEMNYPSRKVIVCGDRVMYDLVPAKELGCTTVHMKWGRGKAPHDLSKYVDIEAENLSQLYEVLESRF